MAKYTITIEKDNRRQIFVEPADTIDKDISTQGNALFHEEYQKAKKIIESFTNSNSGKKRGSHRDSCPEESCQNGKNQKEESEYESFGPKNNIIVFTGDRGTGKTSAMVSFGKYLEKKGTKVFDKDSTDCKLLDMIDPSYFRKNESILLNVITLMFKMAKEHHRNCNSQFHENCDRFKNEESSGYDFNKLLEEFERVFRAVKRMDSLVPKDDSLEYLNELSDAIDLNKSIHNLIENFLRFFKGKLKYLVLMIDDLDMNVAYAATMLEQIRKFLIHDNAIILIATNIDQLQIEMKESYSKYYEKTLHPTHPTQQNASVSVDVEDMATKYLLKLFPPLQRIHINDAANKLIYTELVINGVKDRDLQKVILNLIWKKTRLIFIPEDERQLHPIIPTNLRAFHQFVYLLIDMKDGEIKDDTALDKNLLFRNKNEYNNIKDNFSKFKDYILNVWIPSNVSFEEKKVFDNIPKDIGRINKHLIQSMNVIGSKYKKSILVKEINITQFLNESGVYRNFDRDIYTFVSPNDPKFSNANKISDIFNFPSNNSMGDILLLIDKYKTYFEATNQNNFIEAIKIYYSLLLFETMFCNDEKFDHSKQEVVNISNVQRLIGGNIYFPHYFNIIKSDAYNKFKEERRSLIKKEVQKKVTNLGYKENSEEAKRIYAEGDKRDEEISSIHLFYHKTKQDYKEFFHILYYGESRPERSFGKHIYDTKKADLDVVEDEKKRFRFDILSLLVNVLNPNQALARFAGDKDDKDIEKKKNSINSWNKYNKIGNIQLQSSILPIYSVDLMLKYLKNQVNFSDINSDFQIIVESNDKFFKKFNENFGTTVLKDCKIHDWINQALKELEDQKAINLPVDFKEKIKSDFGKELEERMKMTPDEKKGEVKLKEVSEDLFEEYLMKLMENEIRDVDFISGYYDILNILTKDELKQIELNEENISTIYGDIYEKGRECFIWEDKNRKTERIKKLKEIFG